MQKYSQRWVTKQSHVYSQHLFSFVQSLYHFQANRSLTNSEWSSITRSIVLTSRPRSRYFPTILGTCRQSIVATPPTPAQAGWGRWGPRRTGSQRCCPGWASRRCAGWWRTHNPPPSQGWSQILERWRGVIGLTGGISVIRATHSSSRGSYLSTACGLPGKNPTWSPTARPRPRIRWLATEGRPGGGRWPAEAVLQSKPRLPQARPGSWPPIRWESLHHLFL